MASAKFVTGHLPQLEDALATAIGDAQRGDPLAPVTVLVGHVLLKRYLPRMLALRGKAHINVRFLSPHQLAAELSCERDPLLARQTTAAERLLVRQVAASADGPYFGRIGRGEGFIDALRQLIREIELGGFDASSLRDAVAAMPPDANSSKLGELRDMYAGYVARREAAAMTGLADAYIAADPSQLDGPLIVYGLWSPPEVQLRLLERIVAERDVTVFLPASGLAADDAHAAIRARLGGESIALPATEDDVIARVAGRLFHADDDAEPIATDAVELVSAPDTVREVWEAARTCLRWASEGIAFHEMAVVYRNGDPYRSLVDEIFREANIDVYVHDGRPLAEHPLGRRLLALLDLASDATFSRQQVMEFLTETRLSSAIRNNPAYGHVNTSLWETYTREAGVVANIEQWRARLGRLADERRALSQNEGFERYEKTADRIGESLVFIEDFHAALRRAPAEASWDEHLTYLAEIASSYADGVKPIVEALSDLRGLEAIAPRVSFESFCRAVRDDLDRRDASSVLGEPVRSFGKNGVAALDATSIRHLRFRAVYMLGAAERAWPSPPRPDPLLLEHERAMLNAGGVGTLPMRTSPDTDTLTFWLAVQAARERLTVSFARADAGSSGKHVPSYFFRAVAEALTGRTMTVADVESSRVVQRIAAGRLACDEIHHAVTPAEYDRALIRAAIDGTQPAATAALAAESPAFRQAMIARSERWAAPYSAYDGVMSSAGATARAAALRFGRERAVSASRLELYAKCPYQYFAKYALGLERIEEPEAIDRINALERGSMIHAVLETFLSAIGRDDPPSRDARERHIDQLLEIARAEGASREERGVTGRPLLWKTDQRKIHLDLIRWYDKEISMMESSSMRPGGFEVGFGAVKYGLGPESPMSADAPLVLNAGGREMRLQGRIDRIDWDDARTQFRVIDYKTGGKWGGNAFDGGRSLQLPIYLRAAAQLLDIEQEAGEAAYFYVSTKGKFALDPVSGADLLARSGEFEQVLSTIASGVDNGYFAPNPGEKKKNCKFCDYKDICDRDIDRVMGRKSGNARADAYELMTVIP